MTLNTDTTPATSSGHWARISPARRNRIRVLRAERCWSQEQLAQKLSVSRQTVNSLENDRSRPSNSLALAIARLFDSRVEDVFRLGEDQ